MQVLMNPKIFHSININWLQLITTTFISCVFVTTATFEQATLANDQLIQKNQTNNQDNSHNFPSSFSPAITNPKTATSDTALEKQFVYSQHQEPILTQKQPQKISQNDSSVNVGDTFGEANQLRQEMLIEPMFKVGKPTAAPASSAGTPTAYGASWGQAFFGGGAYFPLDKGKVDGSLTLGFGLGDAVKSAGLEVSVNIISVGGQEENLGDFADSGTVGLKLHKYLSDGTALAVGWSNSIKWGEAEQAKDTIYGVITKSFNPITISLGVGTGSFTSKGAREAGENAANLFGSVGLRLSPEASLVSSWTGNSLNVGASFAPLKQTPIVINTIFTDVTNNLNNGLGFSVSAGYSLLF
jgi:hypothetical protein